LIYFETRERDRPVKPSSTQASEKMLPQISVGQALAGECANVGFGPARFLRVLDIVS
jgi:hypothetical protein